MNTHGHEPSHEHPHDDGHTHDHGHSHDHGSSRHHHHHHDHGHSHLPADNRAFAFGVTLNLAFVAVEGVSGLVSGSLALLADAGHNLGDVFGLLLAWGALNLARRGASLRRTYGWRGSSILAALANGVILLVAVGGITREAFLRLADPRPVSGTLVIGVAAVGLVINTATALLFMKGRSRDLNLRGAFLHMAADAAVSGGVVLAGVGMLWTGWGWIDPVVSLAVAAVILAGTWGLLRDSTNMALAAVPAGIDPEAVSASLASLPGVTGVHDLHIWALSTTESALTAHLVKPQPSPDEDRLISQASLMLRQRFGIHHTTLQWERAAADCASGSDCG